MLLTSPYLLWILALEYYTKNVRCGTSNQIDWINWKFLWIFFTEISEYVPNAFEGLIHPFKSYLTDAFLLLTLVIGIVLLVVRRKHKTVVFRVFLGLWLLVLFIFAALFIAQLSAYYNYIRLSPTTKITSEIASIEDLASQNTIAYGCIKGIIKCDKIPSTFHFLINRWIDWIVLPKFEDSNPQ